MEFLASSSLMECMECSVLSLSNFPCCRDENSPRLSFLFFSFLILSLKLPFMLFSWYLLVFYQSLLNGNWPSTLFLLRIFLKAILSYKTTKKFLIPITKLPIPVLFRPSKPPIKCYNVNKVDFFLFPSKKQVFVY